jgi:hypothetical protein
MLSKEIAINNQLIQHFYIIGLDSNDIFSDTIYNEPLSKNIEPKIISKFPELSYSYNNIPDSLILKHCFPTGFFGIELKFKYKPTPTNFYFTLYNIPVNNLNNEMYKNIYFTCFEFYESLYNYYEIYKKKLNLLNKESSISNEENLKHYYFPKVICVASLLSFPHELSKILSSIYHKFIHEKSKVNYPLEKLVENLVMKIPYPSYGQSISYINFNEKIIMSRNPINKIQNNSVELNLLFSYFSPEDVLTLLKYLILEIPLLCFCKDKYKLTNIVESLLSLLFPFKYIYPSISILPSNCYSIIETFDSYFLGINEEYNENFFKNNNLEIDEKSIVIVIINNNDTFKIKINEPQSNESQSILLEELGNEEKKNINSHSHKIELPSHYKKKTFISLSNYIKKVKLIKEEKNNFNYQIRDKILYFFTSIILDYSNFIKLDKSSLKFFDYKYYSKEVSSIKIDHIFKVQDFINEFSKDDQPFYERFLHTKLFLNFIIEKIYPKSNEERLKILFFDEKIASKKNRSFLSKNVRTTFLNSEISIKDSEIKLTLPSNYSLEEKEFLKEEKNINKAIDYFQIISNDGKSNYNIFPKLLYDNKFFEKPYSQLYLINKIHSPKNTIVQIEEQFQKIINEPKYLNVYNNTNYNLNLINDSKINKITRYNCIDLTWLLVLSGSLWYCEPIEREIRINKIYDLLDKIDYKEEDVFTFIFLAISKYGNDDELIKFYEYLLKIEGFRNYTIYSILCDKLTKIFNAKYLQKTKSQSIRVTLLMRESAMNDSNSDLKKIINNEIYIFRRRSFFPGVNKDNNNNSYDEDEKIQFETEISCDKCGNLFQIDFSNLVGSEISEKLEIKCNLCGSINNNGKIKLNVIIPKNHDDIKIDNFELYSAKKLLKQSKEFILPLIDYKIDIENFRKKYKHLFYNYIFYFSIKNLSFDFLIPYANSKNVEIDSDDEYEEREFENLQICNQTNIIEIEREINDNEIGRSLTNIDNNSSLNNYPESLKYLSSSNVPKINLKIDGNEEDK